MATTEPTAARDRDPGSEPTHVDLDGAWLRPLRPDDADDIVAAVTDPELIRFTRVPTPYDHDLAREFVAACTPAPGEPPSVLALAVPDDRREDGRLVGVVGLDVDPRDGNAELGYWTARDARGRGLTTTAAAAMCDHGFTRLGVARIHLMASLDNQASNRIAARIGCTRTGTARQAILERGPDGAPLRRSDAATWDLLPGEGVR